MFRKETFMQIAETMAQESHAKRMKVGSVLVKNDRIISTGINGTPKGFDNDCETIEGITKPEVVHSELNNLLAAARAGICTDGTDLYCSWSPCYNCAIACISAGVRNFYYRNAYRDSTGLRILADAGVNVIQL